MAPAHRELRTWLHAGHSAITRILNFPQPHKANSAVVPTRGANGRDGFPWAHGQILLVKATQPQSSPVPPTLTASLKEQPEPESHSPAAADGHLGHAPGWWAVAWKAEGRCLWALPLTTFFPH